MVRARPYGPDGPPGILHVDMDAFFAAVEVLDDPSLAGRALIVGGEGPRGVVASCSYEARRFGVRSAMPSVRARRQCPHAVFRPGRHDRYGEVSRQIHEVFNRFTPLVEGISLDEAFLDVRGAVRLLGPAPEIAVLVRAAIAEEVGLTCSVGVAGTKFVAKLASEAAKPVADRDGVRPGPGVVVVPIGGELDFLHPLAVETLWGVGPATATRLRALGLTTVGDLAATPIEVLERGIGRAAGRHLHALAHGLDPRPVEPDRAVKSIGHEETYSRDRRDGEGLHRELVRMSDAVASRLRRAGFVGRTVQLKVRFADFTTITRAHTVSTSVSSGPDIVEVAAGLLSAVDLGPGVRLLGVSVSALTDSAAAPAEQLALHLVGVGPEHQPGHDGKARPSQWDAATAAIDAVRARYGPDAVGPTVLLGDSGLRVGRASDNRWDAVDAVDAVDPSRGDASRGDPSRVDASRGDPSRVDASRGDASRGVPPPE